MIFVGLLKSLYSTGGLTGAGYFRMVSGGESSALLHVPSHLPVDCPRFALTAVTGYQET